MMRAVLDTNALMMPVETDVRVFEELERLLGEVELVVPEAVLAELADLAERGSGKEATAANVGLDLGEERCLVFETEAEGADDAVLELATAEPATFAVTNDGPLKKRCLDAGVPTVSLRGRNKLAITQP